MFADVDIENLHTLISDRDEGKRIYRQLGGTPERVAALLRSNVVKGLDEPEKTTKERVAYFGANALPEKDSATFLELMKNALSDQMMILLMISAVISLVLGLTVADPHTGRVDYEHGWIEGTAILISVMLVSTVTSVNDYQKEQKFKELAKAAPPKEVHVTRGGLTKDVFEDELVVGDVLHVQAGMIVPVDGILIRGVGLRIDESAMTGENDTIEKNHDAPFFRSGSDIIEGAGTVLVVGVGENSMGGRIAMAVRSENEDTPMQQKLTELADLIGLFGMWAAGSMVFVLLLKEAYKWHFYNSGELSLRKFVDIITTAVTIVVVAVPEGLPLSVTIALAYSMKQMMHENNLVRHLAACETMGGATSICTDKTGTLTQNEMTVTQGLIAGRHFNLTGDKENDSEEIKTQVLPHAQGKLVDLVVEGISVNSTASKTSVEVGPNRFVSKYVGNKTEQSMLYFVEKLGGVPSQVRTKYTHDTLHTFPFTSAKKSMTTCLKLGEAGPVHHSGGKGMRFHIKGASEIVLAACTNMMTTDGRLEPLTEERRASIAEKINFMARNRLRTLVLAYADTVGAQEFTAEEQDWPALTFLALLGIEDPIRPEVEEAVGRCKSAGVAVRMVTGDNKATAIAIAKKAGIYCDVYFGPMKGEGGLAMEGGVFRELAKCPHRLNTILPRLQVLARASPLDKQILVNELMKRGEVVAVTGDGTNDAPALKKAHVGFAMNTGTEVAKNASDVVILDDNFRSIVTAMKWGRNVNDNIRKFIQFQTTVNVAAVTIAFVGAVMSGSGESPLKPVQLLWLNLIMDTMAALALATEPPTDALLDRQPRSREAPLITRRMWLNIFGQSVYQIVLQLWLLNGGHKHFKVKAMGPRHLTIVFNIFVLLQVANEFNARMLGQGLNVFRGLSRAPLFLVIIAITLVVQYIGVTFAGEFMRCVPLNNKQWRQCILFSIVPLPLGALLRMIPVREPEVPLFEPVEVSEADEMLLDPWVKKRKSLRGKALFRDAVHRVVSQLKVSGALASAVDEASFN